MEDVALVNNATLCMNVARHGVEGYCAQRTTRHLVVTRNTMQQLHNAKRCTLESCVGLHTLWQVVFVEDRSSCLQRSTE